MNWSNVNSQKANTALNTEQVNQVIAAILSGKYSWACVLLLRFIGYDPLHYIPYRTYNRLLKEQLRSPREIELNSIQAGSRSLPSKKVQTKISDLKYAEAIEEQTSSIQGGMFQTEWIGNLRLFSHSKSLWRKCN